MQQQRLGAFLYCSLVVEVKTCLVQDRFLDVQWPPCLWKCLNQMNERRCFLQFTEPHPLLSLTAPTLSQSSCIHFKEEA